MLLRLKNTWTRYIRWWTVRKVAVLMLAVTVLIHTIEYINQHSVFDPGELIMSFLASVGPELAGIAITVWVIDWLYERREEERLRNQLIRDMSIPDYGIAIKAVQELAAHGWLGSLYRANLSRAKLSNANLTGADLRSAALFEADLRHGILDQADLSGAFLNGAVLTGAGLSKAVLSDAGLIGTQLQAADLTGANLSKARLIGADLSRSYLIDADLSGADLSDANLSEANLRGANLTGATVEDEQLSEVMSLKGATMPDGSKHE